MPKYSSMADRFWAKVERGSSAQCWEWQSTRSNKGYGKFEFNGRQIGSHRVAWAISQGISPDDIPEGVMILHNCDNRLCCNPSHIFSGSHADNMADMAAKGRGKGKPPIHKGERHHAVKLSEDQVRMVRSSPLSAPKLAPLLGVSEWAIYDIRSNRTWRDL